MNLKVLHQFHNLSLYRHIKSRGRLIRNDNIRIADHRNGNDNALLHPSAELMRIFPHSALRIRDTQLPKQFHYPCHGLFFTDFLMLYQPFRHLVAYTVDRI